MAPWSPVSSVVAPGELSGRLGAVVLATSAAGVLQVKGSDARVEGPTSAALPGGDGQRVVR